MLNCVRGDGERSERLSAPWVYWTAFVGSEEPPVGAKMSFEGAELDVDDGCGCGCGCDFGLES